MQRTSGINIAISLTIALVVGVAGEYGVRLERNRVEQDLRSRAVSALEQRRAALESQLDATLFLSSGLTAYIETHPRLEPQAVERMLGTLYGQSHLLRNIGLAPGNRIAYVYPRAGNEQALGLYYPAIPEQWPAVERAIRERKPSLAGPVRLKQGGTGFIYRIPVFLARDGRYWGLLSTVIDADALYAAAGIAPRVDGLQVALRGRDGSGAAGAAFLGDGALFGADALTAMIDTPGGSWQIAVRPRGGWSADARLDWLRAGVWGLGLVLGLLAYSLLLGNAQRTAALREVAEGDAKLRALYELAPLGIALTDLDGRYVEFNQAFLTICGYAAEELPKLDYWTLTPAKYRDDEARQLEALARTGHYGPYEKEYIRKDGSSVPLRLNGVLIRRSDGRQYIWSIVEDISAQRQAEADVRIAATAFEAQVGILVTDAAGVILRVNHAFAEDSGYTVDEIIGRTPRMFKSGRHDAAFYRAMWDSLRRNDSWQGEIWDRRKSGEVYPKWLTITAVKGGDGAPTHYVSSQIDITERKHAEDEIRSLAFYDPLTALPNRRLLRERLHQALAASARSAHNGALLFIDLDDFKTLNDTLGHDKGDQLLELAAARIASAVRASDTVARLGGDEFVVMLENLDAADSAAATQARATAETILQVLNQPYRIGEHEHYSGASIGVTLFGATVQTMEELLKQADLAMYRAKAAGRNAIRFFDPEMQSVVSANAAMLKDLREGVRAEQFVLYYQPQVVAQQGCMGAEVLLRWSHPQRGLVMPNDFIPLAEASGLILPLGNWVLDQVCAQLARWARRPERAGLTLAVNISARQLHQDDFVAQVKDALQRAGADPRRLKLELTESLLMEEVEGTIAKMNALMAIGVGFALDDFGTGYSSLAYLRRLPLECLKIDRSFVKDVLTEPNDAAIARTVVALATSLGLEVIAEGVETEAQRDFLLRHGCLAFQGYLFGRPVPVADFDDFLDSPRSGQGSVAAAGAASGCAVAGLEAEVPDETASVVGT